MSEQLENIILRLFDFGFIFVCIDGLDEAAEHQEQIEIMLERHVKGAAANESSRHARVLISTREHSFIHSRSCHRLLDFDEVKVQSLDSEAQQRMINQRLSREHVNDFLKQVEHISKTNPELANTPFLLNLMIEVFETNGSIPRKRVDLYSNQVKGFVRRCIHKRVEEGENYDDFQFGQHSGNDAALLLSIEFLEDLAFCCQMQLHTREFKFHSCLCFPS